MFEFFLSLRMSFLLVGASRMPRSCAATLPLFANKHPHAKLPLLSSWRRRCGGRAWTDRYMSWLIGVKSLVGRKIPIDSSGFILAQKYGIIRCRVRCLAAFNGTHIHWRRRDWRWDRWIQWLGVVLFVCSNHGHCSQHIEWVGRQVEIIEVGWQNWMLTAKPIWNCGFIGIRIDCDDPWLQRGDGGDCDCLPCHCSW